MHPKQLHKRLVSDESEITAIETDESSKTSLVDEATLLLSIADIAQSELRTCPSALSDSQDDVPTPCLLPKFPLLGARYDSKGMVSRSDSLRGLLCGSSSVLGTGTLRVRSVSIEDSPWNSPRVIRISAPRTPSPLHCPPTLGCPGLVTPTQAKPVIRSARLFIKARHEHVLTSKENQAQDTKEPLIPTTPKNKSLQGSLPKGVAVTKVYRKKFSWKSYPEVSIIACFAL